MRHLVGRIRPYAWGSRTGIAGLQGRPAPAPEPEAELWLGAHPDEPSRLDGATGPSLTEVIAADPAGTLGASCVERFGPRLPYLVKLLAAEAPLSLQVHPDLEQARRGYAAEQQAGQRRNYTDPNHKPELLVAVTDFDSLCGFRPVAESAEVLERLGVPALAPVVASLRDQDPERGLRRAMANLFQLPAGTAAAVSEAAAARPGYELVTELAERYPDDPGVVVTLLLNQVRLRPGEAMYVAPGDLHLHLRGLGLEVMAASDNVLRGGLTGKRVDVPELLRTLRYEELPDPRWPAEPLADGVTGWQTPLPDFRLSRADVAGGPVTLPDVAGPRIVLCLRGEVSVTDKSGETVLTGGQAGFADAHCGPLAAAGHGELFQAATG